MITNVIWCLGGFRLPGNLYCSSSFDDFNLLLVVARDLRPSFGVFGRLPLLMLTSFFDNDKGLICGHFHVIELIDIEISAAQPLTLLFH